MTVKTPAGGARAIEETWTIEECPLEEAAFSLFDVYNERGELVVDAVGEAHARLASAAPDMARALLAIEWSGNEAGTACPASALCDVWTKRHRHDCAIGAVLRKAGVR